MIYTDKQMTCSEPTMTKTDYFRINFIHFQQCSRFFYRINESQYLYGGFFIRPIAISIMNLNQGHFHENFPKF